MLIDLPLCPPPLFLLFRLFRGRPPEEVPLSLPFYESRSGFQLRHLLPRLVSFVCVVLVLRHEVSLGDWGRLQGPFLAFVEERHSREENHEVMHLIVKHPQRSLDQPKFSPLDEARLLHKSLQSRYRCLPIVRRTSICSGRTHQFSDVHCDTDLRHHREDEINQGQLGQPLQDALE